MAGFCKHCGKELRDDESYCPECGMPAESSFTPQPTYAPRKSNSTVAVVIIVLIVALSIVMIALIPMFIDNSPSEKYTVTVKVESVSIDIADSSYYGSMLQARLVFSCNIGSSTESHNFGLWKHIPADGTEYPTITDNTLTLSVSGDPKDITYTVFLVFKNDTGPGPDNDLLYDYADLFDVTSEVTSQVTTPVYYGCSGVTFDDADYNGSVMTFKGDSDPIGCVKMSFTAVKNQ